RRLSREQSRTDCAPLHLSSPSCSAPGLTSVFLNSHSGSQGSRSGGRGVSCCGWLPAHHARGGTNRRHGRHERDWHLSAPSDQPPHPSCTPAVHRGTTLTHCPACRINPRHSAVSDQRAADVSCYSPCTMR